jgi:2-polyprenyl-6-methoxyphenol hydroxylase-like FAD-dependent oxidoreductase
MRVAINGMGIAGPTLAYWLRRTGHEPVLFERAPAVRTGGYLIDSWGLGYEIADRMGIIATLRDRGDERKTPVFPPVAAPHAEVRSANRTR